MDKVLGAWTITYIDTMVTSLLNFKSDNKFLEEKSGLMGTYSISHKDIVLEFPSTILPGEYESIPLKLEAEFNEDFTRFKGSIFNKAYEGGRMSVKAERKELEASDIYDSSWNITYHNTTTCGNITFKEDGSFFQKDGNYFGSWKLNKGILTMEFPSIILPKKDNESDDKENKNYPVLEAVIENYNRFSGSFAHPAYKDGVLRFELTRCY